MTTAKMSAGEAIEHLTQLVSLNDYTKKVDCPYCQSALAVLTEMAESEAGLRAERDRFADDRDKLKAECESAQVVMKAMMLEIDNLKAELADLKKKYEEEKDNAK